MKSNENCYSFKGSRSLIKQIPAIPFQKEDSELSAALEIYAEKKGKAVPRLDAMIASVAINNKCSLHTLDNHFAFFESSGLEMIR